MAIVFGSPLRLVLIYLIQNSLIYTFEHKGLMGYEVEKLRIIKKHEANCVPQEKRKRKSEAGTKDDWQWVIANHQSELSGLCDLLRLECSELFVEPVCTANGRINTRAPLLKDFESILVSLHLLYEV